jgi:general secretion pathway protein D
VYKVPCIGNIPLLGWLFKCKSEIREKTNLFVFITPHIIESTVEAKALYEKKQKHINKVEEGVIKTYRNKRDKK